MHVLNQKSIRIKNLVKGNLSDQQDKNVVKEFLSSKEKQMMGFLKFNKDVTAEELRNIAAKYRLESKVCINKIQTLKIVNFGQGGKRDAIIQTMLSQETYLEFATGNKLIILLSDYIASVNSLINIECQMRGI